MKKQTLDLSGVNFRDLTNDYGDLSSQAIFFTLFKKLPSYLFAERDVDSQHSIDYIEKNLAKSIVTKFVALELTEESAEKVFSTTFILDNNLIIKISDEKLKFYFLDRKDKRIDDVLANIKKKAPYKNKSSSINFILQSHGGLVTKESKLINRKIDLKENYNDDLVAKTDSIIKSLAEEKSGIYLFHGKPGTGKSNYIRYLKTKCDKKFIFMPLNIAANVDNPELLGLLMNNPNSVLIIEDAEKLITARDNDPNSTIAALLNLSDGLIGQTLNIQIICTFNTNLSKVDPALRRKGRMLDAYEFKELSLEKTLALAKKVGHNDIKKPMVLADIFNHNQEEIDIHNNISRIGFSK